MPIGVTTLAQFNGADGLGDDKAEQAKMLVGVGSLALLMLGLVVAGGTARALVANKKTRKGKRKLRGKARGGRFAPNGRPYPTGHRNKAYTHFVVLDGRILTGWEFAEDARDAKRDLHPSDVARAKVLTKAGAKRIGLDPARSASWSAGGKR